MEKIFSFPIHDFHNDFSAPSFDQIRKGNLLRIYLKEYVLNEITKNISIEKKQLEDAMIKAMEHKYFQSFLTDIGLDSTSVVGADEWGKQMEVMLAEMTAQLKALGYIN